MGSDTSLYEKYVFKRVIYQCGRLKFVNLIEIKDVKDPFWQTTNVSPSTTNTIATTSSKLATTPLATSYTISSFKTSRVNTIPFCWKNLPERPLNGKYF